MNNYNSVINTSLLTDLKCAMHQMVMNYNSLLDKKSCERRTDDRYEVFTEQLYRDLNDIRTLRDQAQDIVDWANEITFKMSIMDNSQLMHRLYNEHAVNYDFTLKDDDVDDDF